MENKKQQYGQFFTITNPFGVDAFCTWLKNIPEKNITILEPFAGANNIINLVNIINKKAEIGKNLDWKSFDIDTSFDNNAPDYPITQQDTIKNYPKGFKVAITNPPYLAKNSATRSGIPFPETDYDDLYKLALSIMLNNTPYVAAIIPESFITSGLFQDRLQFVVSLTCKMFDDTDCPVCLALFIPELSDDFIIYNMNHKIGSYKEIKRKVDELIKPNSTVNWKFNDKDGIIGIRCIDNTKEPSIEFIPGDQISPSKIKVSSRSLTRVSGIEITDLEKFLNECNKILKQYRLDTNDIFLTSFKNLREDGCYRRRLDFKTAKDILNTVVNNGGNYA